MSEADFCFDEGQYLADELQYEREHKYDPNIKRIKNQREEIKRLNNLINRQQEMIDALIAGQETLQKALVEKIAEIERLQVYKTLYEDVNAEYLETIECIKKTIETAKAEAIKEFAER